MNILVSVPHFSGQLSQVPNKLPCTTPGTPTTSLPPALGLKEVSAGHSLVMDWLKAKTEAGAGHFTSISSLFVFDFMLYIREILHYKSAALCTKFFSC